MFALTRLRLSIAFIATIAFATLLALAAFSSTASADHQWGSYHWASTTYPLALKLGDNLTSNWDEYLLRTAGDFQETTDPNDWDAPAQTVANYQDRLDLTVVKGGTNNPSGPKTPKKCAPTSGQVEVCNAAFGNNGWLGLAQIWASGNTIVQGTAKMNDSYFGTSKYNQTWWKNMVMCQEVGHTFGLAHVNETFDDLNTGSCMDYSNNPNGGGTNGDLHNEFPNAHDYDELMAIYPNPNTTASSTSAASDFPAEANRGDLNSREDWGQLKRRSADGAVEIYERDFGKGKKVITRVIRVVEKTPTPDSSGRPAHDDGHTHDDGVAH